MKSKKLEKGQKTKLYISGMHCPSCELLIENTLLESGKYKEVNASLRKRIVEITPIKNEKVDERDLDRIFKDEGYRFSKSERKESEVPLFARDNGSIKVDRFKLKYYIKVLFTVLSIVILVGLINNLQLGRDISVEDHASLTVFFALGLVAGLSSCAALVGSILLALSKQWHEMYITEKDTKKKFEPHILFHAGRLLGFFLLGGILGIIGKTIAVTDSTSFSVITIAVSLIMILLGLQMLGVRRLEGLRIGIPRFIAKHFMRKGNFRGRYLPVLTGAFTFFLPCGFTLLAQGMALTASGFLRGGLIMLVFALGTMPVLLGVSISGVKFNSKPRWTKVFNTVAGLLIVAFMIYTINSQFNVLGLPSLNDIEVGSSEDQGRKDDVDVGLPEIPQGKQSINILASGFSYMALNVLELKADEPAILAVNNQGIEGCGRFMAAKGLFQGYFELKPGWNYKEITPKKGTYKLTCTMGMVPPVLITVK